MSITLRDYQLDAFQRTRQALRKHKDVLLQLATGGGKTCIASKMILNASKKTRCFFNVHRIELIEQAAATLDNEGIPFGIIAADYKPDPFQPVQICSINTLARRADRIAPPGLVIWDEAHHCAAKGWADLKARYSSAFHVGLTATPERLDGKGLIDHFNFMVKGPSPAWLMQKGYLAKYKIFASSGGGIDTNGLHHRFGQFITKELDEVSDKPKITGDAIRDYHRRASGKRGIITCVSVKHSEHVAEQFKTAGIMAYHLDGTTPKEERGQAIQAFRDGHIKLLSNVGLFGEGFDVPDAEVCIDLAPTESLTAYLQRVGRVLRPKADGSHAILLDHANNSVNADGTIKHGFPDDERNWSLMGADKRGSGGDSEEDGITTKQCSRCFHVHKPAPKCPECGFVYPKEERIIEHIEGDLKEIDPAAFRRQQAFEQYSAESLDDLIELGKERGYSKPQAWAAHVFTARKNAKRKRGVA